MIFLTLYWLSWARYLHILSTNPDGGSGREGGGLSQDLKGAHDPHHPSIPTKQHKYVKMGICLMPIWGKLLLWRLSTTFICVTFPIFQKFLELKLAADTVKCLQTIIYVTRYWPESRASNLLFDHAKNICNVWPSFPTVRQIERPVEIFKYLSLTPKWINLFWNEQ